MPETDINPASFDDQPDDLEITDETAANAPQKDAAETNSDPSDIEVSRGRELGLGVGARDLARQRDVHTGDDVEEEGGVEKITPDDPRWA